MNILPKAKSFIPNESDLSLINQYTRRIFSPEEVYTFSVVLCDNEIDRDFERFTIPALHKLAELFVGKTGIFDHNPSGKNQTARIYAAEVESVSDQYTSCGEPYTFLKARAYMIRSDQTAPLITEIDGGIKKEVSVGCAVAETSCSICGIPSRTGCSHQPGKTYEGVLCHRLLAEPTDAYEWSFVAVPAQRNAGITKEFSKQTASQFAVTPIGQPAERRKPMRDWNELKKALELSADNVLLQKEEAELLNRKLKQLDREAELGKQYRQNLQKEVRSLAYRAGETLDASVLESVTEKMDISELLAFRKAYEARTLTSAPPQLQAGYSSSESGENSVYRV